MGFRSFDAGCFEFCALAAASAVSGAETTTKELIEMKTKQILAALFMMGAAAAVNAQDKATLDLLVSKGVITRAEADKIGKESVQVTPKEKTTKSIKISALLQTQYQNISVEQFNSTVSTYPKSVNDFILRRVYLGFDADIGSGWSAKIVADFAAGNTTSNATLKNYLNEAIISKKVDYSYLKGRADLGYRKVNFGYEENTSSAKLLSVEHSLATLYFTGSKNTRRIGLGARHTGAFWNGEVQQVKGLEYGFAVANSYNDNPSKIPTGATSNLSYWGNVAYTAKIEELSVKTGFNFGYTNGANVGADSSSYISSIYGLNPYIAANMGALTIWSDFLYAGMSNGKGAGYAQASSPRGFNAGVEYKFDIGELGQLGPTFRYAWLDTNGRGVNVSDGIRDSSASTVVYDAAQSLYIGINWYISGEAVKFQIGYEWAQFSGSPTCGTGAGTNNTDTVADANAIRAQMQVMF